MRQEAFSNGDSMTTTHDAVSPRPSFLDSLYSSRLAPPRDLARFDFNEPKGDPGFFGPGSVTWVVFANPVPMAVGGIAATILELAEPRVRAGVWNHSSFRKDPLTRVQRTGIAALVTAYGGRAQAEQLTARVRKMHDKVRGIADNGEPYWGNDPELLRWVHVTAAWGFLQAYRRYVNPSLSREDQDRYYAEALPGAHLYGMQPSDVPTSRAATEACFAEMEPRLEPSAVLDEFLQMVREVPFLLPTTGAQQVIVDAAIDLLPSRMRTKLGLESGMIGSSVRTATLRGLAQVMAWGLRASPAHQACARVGADPSVLVL